MQLTVRQVAGFFDVSEKTVYRWISKRELPAYRFDGEYRFNRSELLEWATARRVNFSADLVAESDAPIPAAKLSDALQSGGIFYRVSGTDRDSVLRAVVDMMRLPDETDRDFLWRVLVAREAMASTAVGDGLAIPHMRHPAIFHVEKPTITLSFLERPVDYGALDGKPVAALFTMVTPTVRAHLALLARLAYALREDAFKSAILRQAPREEILAEAARIDASLVRNSDA